MTRIDRQFSTGPNKDWGRVVRITTILPNPVEWVRPMGEKNHLEEKIGVLLTKALGGPREDDMS